MSRIKVLRIIDILNFSSRNNKLFVRWDAYKLLSSVDSNTIKIRWNYSPIKIINNIVVANKIPVSINKRIGIGELRSELKNLDINLVKKIYSSLFNDRNKRADVLLTSMQLVSDSIINEDKYISLLKLIFACDALFEREKDDKRHIKDI